MLAWLIYVSSLLSFNCDKDLAKFSFNSVAFALAALKASFIVSSDKPIKYWNTNSLKYLCVNGSLFPYIPLVILFFRLLWLWLLMPSETARKKQFPLPSFFIVSIPLLDVSLYTVWSYAVLLKFLEVSEISVVADSLSNNFIWRCISGSLAI